MSMTMQNFQEMVNIAINKGKANNLTTAAMEAKLTALATALGTDTTVHADTVEAPPTALQPNLGR